MQLFLKDSYVKPEDNIQDIWLKEKSGIKYS